MVYGDKLEMCKPAITQLVKDLARLGIAVWIVFIGLRVT
jgi:hypothetical protein